ncbi:hypothetical protein JCM16418_5157 [Paenibacillus pini JCM 16418]|uniref:Uncharacterized protein n=1 Tax=Paenibacillus pini JCM 16418 TaxID=1236976 RepID=W7YJ34_9BACL|nr:hypothetical protein JCM16418_5157 [Paenibacillus pini JCM 16418]
MFTPPSSLILFGVSPHNKLSLCLSNNSSFMNTVFFVLICPAEAVKHMYLLLLK